MQLGVDSYRLRTNGLKKNYGNRKVVNGVDISIQAGKVTGLLGPNGAGKTTTYNNYPILLQATACHSITIGQNGKLAISGPNMLTISGNWNNNGTFLDNSGTINFNGVSPTISGATTFTI